MQNFSQKPIAATKATLCIAWASLCFSAVTAASAQAQEPPERLPSFKAMTMAGARWNPQIIKGNVVVVFYWSTTCSVCRDILPELRNNQAGWRNRPFTLVTVNVDRRIEDWQAYERILGTTRANAAGSISLRLDSGQPVPAKLPLTLLVDTQGKVVARYEGRLAPEVWDGVADLMP